MLNYNTHNNFDNNFKYIDNMIYNKIDISYDEDMIQESDNDLQLIKNISKNIKNLIVNFTISFENINDDILYDIFKKYFQNLPPMLEKLIIDLHVEPYHIRIYPEQINKDKLYNCIKTPFNCNVNIRNITVGFPY